MGRPTATNRYPLYFLDILDKLKIKDRVPLHFEARSDARNFQMDFLSFRSAAVKEGWDQPYAIPSQSSLDAPEVIPAQFPELNAYKTKLFQKDGLFWVEIYHMDVDGEMQRQLNAM